ncbi:hypothetical protein JRO89_XS04G0093000 [Xanthoceras sorbifolium]|uniref:Mechanosensitive ion channel MscS domain-containing protein n=1 Tax=Xanthoceras sorbifolium TaxID=99658 RepID=A0ABQ8I4N9_9ROSI|nr:hypothetical protein JRO89_XS04G0093000 [Xanthoceras sorbifolium]
MDNQIPEHQKPNTDQVVLFMDELNPKHKEPTLESESHHDPISQTPARTKTFRGLSFSKPKSRFAEISYPHPPKPMPVSEELQSLNTHDNTYSSTDEDDDDDDEWFENIELEDGEGVTQAKYHMSKKRNMNKRALIEWTLFLIIMTCLICTLTLKSLKSKVKWGLEIWKWCLMVMVFFCGRLVSGWLVGFLVLLIERNFMLREKSFQNCAWLAFALLSWLIMFPNVHKHHPVLKKLFRALIAVLIGATIWLLKIVLVKVLASSFHVTTFFDRMKESVFHHYILEALSGPPLDETEMETPRLRGIHSSKSMPAKLRNGSSAVRTVSRRIDMERLKKLSLQRRATSWSVKRLVKYVRSSGLSTISKTVDDFEAAESEIHSEWKARTIAQRIFKHVAKPSAKLKDCVDEVHACIERKALAHSLNDTKTAVQQLHKLASAIVMVVIIVVSLLVLGVATTNVVFLVTSQLLVAGFMFQNTCKTIFESIIFVFVMHPFDVGDRCVIDGVQMIVEEMNILTTVFLRYDMEKIYFPNSVLITKAISNFRRSPEMGDSVEFTVDVSTPVDDINAMKRAIQTYVESKPKNWNPKHVVLVKEIENLDKLKIVLCVQHTMNHQNYGEKSMRRSELVLELKRIFENLGIRYHLLPQQVNLSQVNTINNNQRTEMQS